MTDWPVRRVAWVLLAYAAVAWIVLRGADWLRGVLALPPLFRTLAIALIVAGVPVAILVAWRYPELGGPDDVGSQSSADEVGTTER